MKNKKAQNSLWDKTIKVILVALVIVLALAFLINVDMQKWLNFLPSFGVQENSTKYVDKCPVKIAEIKDGMIFFCNQETKVCDIPSKLQVDGEKVQVHNTNIIIPDTNIGQKLPGLIIINDEIVKREGKTYFSIVSDLPDYSNIINLYGAYLHSETEICRNSLVTEEKSKYIPEEKIGILKYESRKNKIYYYAIIDNYNTETKQLSKSSNEEDSNLFIENNFVYVYRSWFRSFKVGVRDPQTNFISVYSQYKSDESLGINPGNYLQKLNGAEIVNGEIYKKR